MSFLEAGPCMGQMTWVHAFIAAMNVVQLLVGSYVARHAYKRNRDERRRHRQQRRGD